LTLVATVLIPARNEGADIAACLACVGAQDVGAAALEVVLIDGGSTDRTSALAHDAAAALALHRGLALASTPYVVRVDARSRIEPHHVTSVVQVLATRPDVGVVGGAQVPLDRGDGAIAAGIARALSNRYTTGFSRYRRSSRSGSADTVWMGAFRTAELRALGGWDPDHGINEDFELNSRYRRAGYVVWFDGQLRSGYLPRPDLGALARQYFAFGRAKGALWAGAGTPELRQLVLVAAPVVGAGAAALATRRFGLMRSMTAVLVLAAAVDHAGTSGPSARPAVRCAALAALATFASSWWAGVVVGWAADA
jgi:succinoglycan biosynthesis protein ExoA